MDVNLPRAKSQWGIHGGVILGPKKWEMQTDWIVVGGLV